MLALVCGLLTACTSKESLISDYEKACQKGDAVEALKIADKLEKEYKDKLTDDDEDRIYDASKVLSKSVVK